MILIYILVILLVLWIFFNIVQYKAGLLIIVISALAGFFLFGGLHGALVASGATVLLICNIKS
ncbi:MAG: hypothetical protein VB100_04640 [Angelakisella sp.]|nr:hypothetical protein [Angelakisella sp.]